MSNISNIIDKAKEFAKTPAGRVATNGISCMASMAISGLILGKFFPARATFARALGAGIYCVGIQTLIGTAMTDEQQSLREWENEVNEQKQKEAEKEITRLRLRIAGLLEKLNEFEDKEAAQENEATEDPVATINKIIEKIGQLGA